jgi:DNA polymerase-3 subunit gamma/tau
MNVLLRALIAAFRNLLVARVDPELLARDLAPEDAQRAAERSRGTSQAVLVRALRVLTEAASLARSGANPRLELETALLRFVLVAEDPTLDALAARVASLEEGHAVAPAPKPAIAQPAAPEPAAPASRATGKAKPAPKDETPDPVKPPEPEPVASGPLSVQRLKAAWQSIRGKVEGERQPLRAPLSRAVIESLDGDTVVLKLPDTWSADTLRENASLIENAIADVLGARLRVTLRVDGSGSASGRTKGSAPGGVASVTADAPEGADADELFSYANERIKER